MKHSAIILGLAAVVAGAAVGSPSDSGSIEPVEVATGKVAWEGSVYPGGPIVQHWGSSLEEIEAEIQKHYPDFIMYSDEYTQGAAVAGPGPDLDCSPDSQGRFGEIKLTDLDEGIQNLAREGKTCSAKARTCIRTQCHGKTAIGLCNDGTEDLAIPCVDVALFAYGIGDICRLPGQMFSTDRSWNVIVAECDFFGYDPRPV